MLSYTANINARQRLESSHGMMQAGISCKVDEVRSIVEGVMVVVNRDEEGELFCRIFTCHKSRDEDEREGKVFSRPDEGP